MPDKLKLADSVYGLVHTSCFCRAELNSWIKFDISTAEARRLHQSFLIWFGRIIKKSSTRSAVLHDSGTAAIQTSGLCRVEPNEYILEMCFRGYQHAH